MRPSLLESLKIGRDGEEVVKELLNWAGVTTSFNESKDHESLKKHDLVCELHGVRFSIEVKNDRMEATTGNLAIEYFNPKTNKPSGVSTTTSDLWVVVLGSGVWVCKTDDLKAYFSSNLPVRVVKRGGDGNASLKLFKSDEILPTIFTQIDLLPPWEILSCLRQLMSIKSVPPLANKRSANARQNMANAI